MFNNPTIFFLKAAVSSLCFMGQKNRNKLLKKTLLLYNLFNREMEGSLDLQEYVHIYQKKKFVHILQAAKADLSLEDLMAEHDILKKALCHNIFGCKCLDAGLNQKAFKHFQMAVNTKIPIPFTNALMNLGNFYSQEKDLSKAAQLYYQVIQQSCHSVHYDLQQVPAEYREAIFSSKLNSINAFADAHTNLSVIEVNRGNQAKAYQLIMASIRYNPKDTVALTNLGDILRQIGRQKEAIDLTWQLIQRQIQTSQAGYKIPPPIIQPPTKQRQQSIDILTVKWGTRYPAFYANRLFLGIKKYYDKPFKFICFTDDVIGLHPDIIAKALEPGWQGWWGKATLFSYESDSKKVYIDLDTVLVGDLTDIFSYQGPFGILGSGMFQCEKKHKIGVNSSLMIWSDSSQLKQIYERLNGHFQHISKYIRRFDFWLEMNLGELDRLEEVYEGQIVDFLKDCQKQVAKGARIVNFPRKPKPQDYPAEWIREYWTDEPEQAKQ